MAEQKESILLDIKIDADQVTSKLVKLKTETITLKDEQSKLKKQIKEAFAKGNVAEVSRLTETLVENENAIKIVNEQTRNYQKQLKLTKELEEARATGEETSLKNVRKARDLAQTQLNELTGTLKQNADGTIELSDTYEDQKEQVEQLNQVIIDYGQGINDGRANVGRYAESLGDLLKGSKELKKEQSGLEKQNKSLTTALAKVNKEANPEEYNNLTTAIKKNDQALQKNQQALVKTEQSIKASKKQTGDLGGAMSGLPGPLGAATTSLGTLSQAMKAFLLNPVVAVLAAIVGAFLALRKAFLSSEEGQNKLAKVTEVFSVILGKLFDVIKPLADFIFDSVITAFQKMSKAAEAAGKIVSSTLSFFGFDKAAESIDKFVSSADKAVGDAQRIADLRAEADVKERELIVERAKIEAKVAEAREKAYERENISAQEREKLLRQAADLNDELFAKEEALARLRFDAIKLENEQASSGKEEKKAEAEAEAALFQASKKRSDQLKQLQSDLLRVGAESKKQSTERAKAAKEEEKRITQIRNTEIDIRLQFIRDGQTRELAILAEQTKRRLGAIEGSGDEEKRLRELIAQEAEIRAAEIQKKFAEETKQRRLKAIQDSHAEELRTIDETFRDQERSFDQELTKLDAQLQRKQISQEEFNERQRQLDAELQAARLQRLNDELAAEAAHQQQLQKIEEDSFQQNKQGLEDRLEEGKINKQQFDFALEELEREHNERISEITQEGADTRAGLMQEIKDQEVEITKTGNANILAAEKDRLDAEKKLADARLNAARGSLASLKDIFGQSEETRKKFAGLIKGIAVAEIGINLQQELSQIATNAQAAGAASGPFAFITAGGLFAVQSALAIARAGAATANVLATSFSEGGDTDTGGKKSVMTFEQAIDMVNGSSPVVRPTRTTSRSESIDRQFSNDQYYMALRGMSVAPGGHVSKGRLAIVGEKGREWIASNKVVEHPVFRPIIESMEKYQRTGVLPFAQGGFSAAPSSIPVLSRSQATEDLVGALRELNLRVYVQDINEAQGIIVDVEDHANV